MKKNWMIPLLVFSALNYGGGCEQKTRADQAALRKLYGEYQFGQIEKCNCEGRQVYHAGINAMDAGTQVYDSAGRSIATCNYFARMVDPPCEKLTDCEVLYRCANHISGEPAVNRLGFSDTTTSR